MPVLCCAVCFRTARDVPVSELDGAFDTVRFADYTPLPEPPQAMVGDQADGCEWFCRDHLPAAQARSRLTLAEAMTELRSEFGAP